jgi:hypothetical protein
MPTLAPCRPSTRSAKEPSGRAPRTRSQNGPSGSSSWACGIPKTASTASPANFSVAAEALDLGVDQLEEFPQELTEVLRVEQLAERGRTREVGEEDGDDAPFLPLVAGVRRGASVLVQGEAAEEQKAAVAGCSLRSRGKSGEAARHS